MPQRTLLTIVVLLIFFATLAVCNKKKQNVAISSSKIGELIYSINNNNAKVKSILYPEISCSRAKSTLFYEKPSRIQITSTFLGGKESEVFSDEKTFWFWLKSFDPNSVYFCNRENIHLTRVINPLRPDLLVRLAGLDEIPSDAKLVLMEGYYEVFVQEEAYLRKLVLKDRLTRQTFYKDGEEVLIVDFVSMQDIDGIVVPKQIKLSWKKENISMTMDMGTPLINTNVPPIKMPYGLKKINLEGY